MDDRNIMEGILLLEKGVCDLYMHGTIESSSKNVHRVFKSALEDSLTMQDGVYTRMQDKGWYKTDKADQTKVISVKNKFETVTA